MFEALGALVLGYLAGKILGPPLLYILVYVIVFISFSFELFLRIITGELRSE